MGTDYDTVHVTLPRCPYCGCPDYKTQRSIMDSPGGRRGRSPGMRRCKCLNPECGVTFKISLDFIHPVDSGAKTGR